MPANMTAEVKARDTVKVQLVIDRAELEELDRLQEVCRLKTRVDLFNTALTLLKWAVRHRAKGCVIAALDETHKLLKELSMPCLDYVAPHDGPQKPTTRKV